MEYNKLTMNLKKAESMLIGTKQKLSKCRKICINIDNILLETVENSKLSGVYIYCNLSGFYHIDIFTNKILKIIGLC